MVNTSAHGLSGLPVICKARANVMRGAILVVLIAVGNGCGARGDAPVPSDGNTESREAADGGVVVNPLDGGSEERPWCTPLTCATENADCGPIGDGCGGIVECGTCSAPETCGGGGEPSRCGSDSSSCTPRTCGEVGATCGFVADGCGDVIQCGDCAGRGLSCGGDGIPNQCGGRPPVAGECPATRSCEALGVSCGLTGDGCGGTLDCGSCAAPDTCGGGGVPHQCGRAACIPLTCAQATAFMQEPCGVISDGCGGVIENCAVSCEAPETCGGGGTPDRCGVMDIACVPLTAAELCTPGSCGIRSNGCGGAVVCGSCTAPSTCGGGAFPNTCGTPACVPLQCAEVGAECGLVGDGCGGVIDCGTCADGICGGAGIPFQCATPVCTPLTCADVNAGCGLAGDGCGDIIDCGRCPANESCGGGGVPSQCGAPACTPRTCRDVDATCGAIGDGCGGVVQCGSCVSPETCGGGQVPSVCGRRALTPSPTCGNGVLDLLEACDDGNATSDDGCSEGCLFVEPGYACDTAGGPCRSLDVCGDGFVSGGELCDDRNASSDDGCSAACQVEAGWRCPVVGAACEAARCGDGLQVAFEECDDGNSAAGDGCTAACVLEPGHKCDVPGQACLATTCGDGIREGAEACDDGNFDTGDGCSPVCTFEPVCSGGTCVERCGDGIVLGAEGCDDGNTRDNDGCSSTCRVEPGFTCRLVADTPVLPIVYRDFVGTRATDSNTARTGDFGPVHRDFEKFNGCREDVNATLDAVGKPVLLNRNSCVESSTTFAQWYRSDAAINRTLVESLSLTPVAGQSNTFEFFDSTFFPLTGKAWTDPTVRCGNNQTCEQVRTNAQNFHFTSETRYWFTFRGGEKLTFDGDDDVWVFIDRKLAVDIGGVHGAIQRWIQLPDPDDIDPLAPLNGQRGGDSASTRVTAPATLGLNTGRNYEVAVFQAERHTEASQYRLTLQNFLSARSVCTWTCGDGVATRYEACDEGPGGNTGGYGACNPDCLGRGPRCGDGIVQSPQERCDDGVNSTLYTYGADSGASCGPGCEPPVLLSACVPLTCAAAGSECGLTADGCGSVIDCGTCPDGRCELNVCLVTGCIPTTCTDADGECGLIADGCGNVVDCGGCPPDTACGAGGEPNRCGSPVCAPRSCSSVNAECGVVGDGCGGSLSCGACPAGQTCGGAGVPFRCGVGSCTARTCGEVGATCGVIGDGCGVGVACGECAFPLVCGADGTPNQCGGACIPTTCALQGANCGRVGDGCGGSLDCGVCPEDQVCGAAGPNRCGTGCAPATCEDVGAECGLIGDGCGGTTDCGACPAGSACGVAGTPNQCAPLSSCVPQTCARAGAQCGLIGDGCGGVVDCGPCGPGTACGVGGAPNQCAPLCTPRGCADVNAECGYVADGCGGIIDCGACAPPGLCGYGNRPNVCGVPQSG